MPQLRGIRPAVVFHPPTNNPRVMQSYIQARTKPWHQPETENPEPPPNPPPKSSPAPARSVSILSWLPAEQTFLRPFTPALHRLGGSGHVLPQLSLSNGGRLIEACHFTGRRTGETRGEITLGNLPGPSKELKTEHVRRKDMLSSMIQQFDRCM